jgi:hemolysin III
MNKGPAARAQSACEERASILVHALGALLAAGALLFMLRHPAARESTRTAVTVGVFGVALVAVYAASTAAHLARGRRAQRTLLAADQLAIFLLIGGTYTPVSLVGVGGFWGWAVFALVWALSTAGAGLRLLFGPAWTRLYLAIYVLAGWSGLVAAPAFLAALSGPGVALLLAGGACYTGGVVFFLWHRLPFHHAIWHGIVVLGSAFHFLAVCREVLGMGP